MVPHGKKIAVVLLILILMVAFTAGCGVIKSLISGEETEQPAAGTESGLAPENIEGGQDTGQEGEKPTITDPIEVTLYFADPDGNSLAAEVRTIQKVEGMAKAVINELIAGPDPGNQLLPTIPQGTTLLDINVKEDGLCVVDFSADLIGGAAEGVISDNLKVYSIVNTLSEFPSIERVQFRIDGQTVESLGEDISALAPITADPGLVNN